MNQLKIDDYFTNHGKDNYNDLSPKKIYGENYNTKYQSYHSDDQAADNPEGKQSSPRKPNYKSQSWASQENYNDVQQNERSKLVRSFIDKNLHHSKAQREPSPEQQFQQKKVQLSQIQNNNNHPTFDDTQVAINQLKDQVMPNQMFARVCQVQLKLIDNVANWKEKNKQMHQEQEGNQKKMDEYEDQVKKMADQLQKAHEIIEQMQQKHTNLETHIEFQTQQFEQKHNEVKELHAVHKKKDQDVNNHQEEIQQLNQKIRGQDDQMKNHGDIHEKLVKKLNAQNSTIEELDSHLKQFYGENENLKSYQNNHDDELQMRETQIQSHMQKIESLTNDNFELAKIYREQQQEGNLHKSQLTDVHQTHEQSMSVVQTEVERLTKTNEALEKENMELKQVYSRYHQSDQQMQDQLTALVLVMAECDSLRGRVKQSQQEVEDVRNFHISQIRESSANIKESYATLNNYIHKN